MSPTEPSQLNAQITSTQGVIYETIGNVTGSSAWKENGKNLQENGKKELEAAKAKQHVDAVWDQAAGKLKSGWGIIAGDQDKQTEGNLQNERGNLEEAQSKGEILPAGGSETIKGKLETAAGIITGDQERQNAGNVRVQKAELQGNI
ncbi:CsbD-like [Phaffia rhodozyma]|uniref:CsbD-like n=1 Tax=Phaffia rhodozyma TaxID=264483 RepID=A0A0F7SGV5_PHARH|nr:CsbD-like [Phaffia rhodozyma]